MIEISLGNKDRVWPSLGSDQVKLLILLVEVGKKRVELGLRIVVLGLKLLRLGILRPKNPE
jgi:hypothetical protein